MKVELVGLGKAGLPLAAVIAEAGLEIVGVDISEERVQQINSGKNPFPEEPGLSEIISKHGGKGFRATTDSKKASLETTVHIVLVPLVLDQKNKPDFTYLDSALKGVRSGLKKGDIVVIETTLPVGTTEERFRPLLEKGGLKAGVDFYLAYSPERMMSGFALSRFKEFPKIIGGIDAESGKKAFEAYSKFLPKVQLVSSSRTAEMVKIAEGVYRDVNIAVANELFKLCEEKGIDFGEMRVNANHKYCHIHEPGIGVGGHCIPVYPWFLINMAKKMKKKEHTALMLAARKVNDRMVLYWKGRIIDAVKKLGKAMGEARICVYGITYRPGVKELYHTRSIPLIAELKKEGLKVFAYDDMLSKEEIVKLGLEYAKPEECDYVFKTHAIQKEKWD